MSDQSKFLENIKNKARTNREYLTLSGEGKYIVRILQNLDDQNEAPFEEYYLHRIYHPKYKQEASVKCIHHKCPLCEHANEMFKKNPQEAWRFKSQPVYLYNVIDRSNGKLKVMKLTWKAHEAVKAKIIEAAMDGVNITSFTKGRDLEIEVRRVNDKVKYKGYILSETESKPVSPKILEEVKMVKPITEMYQLHTAQELKQILKGEIPTFNPAEKRKPMSKSSLIESITKKHTPHPAHSDKEPPKSTEPQSDKINERLKKLGLFEDDDKN